jgi:hypothetical protein
MGGVAADIRMFLTLALVGGEQSSSRLGHLTLGERGLCTHWIGGWLGSRTCLTSALVTYAKVVDLISTIIYFFFLPWPEIQ